MKGYRTIPEVKEGLEKYFEFYNNARHHQGLGYKMPAQVYFGETERLENAVRAGENLTLAMA